MNCVDCYNLRTIKKSSRPKGKENAMLARCVKSQIHDDIGDVKYFRMNPLSKKNAAFQREYCEFWDDMDDVGSNSTQIEHKPPQEARPKHWTVDSKGKK